MIYLTVLDLADLRSNDTAFHVPPKLSKYDDSYPVIPKDASSPIVLQTNLPNESFSDEPCLLADSDRQQQLKTPNLRVFSRVVGMTTVFMVTPKVMGRTSKCALHIMRPFRKPFALSQWRREVGSKNLVQRDLQQERREGCRYGDRDPGIPKLHFPAASGGLAEKLQNRGLERIAVYGAVYSNRIN